MKPIIVGHRGVAGSYPENTRASFQAAVRVGVSWIELDVQPTADNVLVVCHDHDLERCSNGYGRVDEHPLAVLKQLDFGHWFAPEFQGEQIMTLDELLVFVRESQLCVNIEIKVDEKHDKMKVAGLLYESLTVAGTPPEKVIVSSFDGDALRYFYQLSDQYPMAVLTGYPDEDGLQLMKDIHAVACNIDYRAVTHTTLERIHQHGAQVWVYTVNDPGKFLFMDEVDGIFTDFPERFGYSRGI